MKAYYILGFLAVAATFEHAVSDEAEIYPEGKLIKKCLEKTNATERAYDGFLGMYKNLDDSREGKCFLQCNMESFGMMKEDGSMDNDIARAFFEKHFVANTDSVMGVWKACQEKEGKESDKCEKAYNQYKCFFRGNSTVKEEIDAWAKNIVETCMRETNASKNSTEKLMKYWSVDPDAPRELKCFIRCTMEKFGVLSAEGVINNSKTRYIINLLVKKKDEVDRMWRDCQTKAPKDDRCNYVHGVVHCLFERLHEADRSPSQQHQ